MKAESSFRGYHAIAEVVSRLVPLVEHAKQFSGGVRVLRLYRKDLDLILRWPKAAKMQGFEFTEGRVTYQGFELCRDVSVPRYDPHKTQWDDL